MPLGSIDPASGQYIYGTDDPRQPMVDVLNLAQNAARDAAIADRLRLTSLEQLVGSAYGVALLGADTTVGSAETTVPFDTSGPMSGVTRSGGILTVQSPGVYLVVARMAGTLSGTAERDLWVTKNGTTVVLDASTARAAAGSVSASQYVASSFTVATLSTGDTLRIRTSGGAGASSVVLWQRMTMFAVLKVSG